MQWGAYATMPTVSSQAKQIMANMGYNPVQNTQAFYGVGVGPLLNNKKQHLN